VLANTQIIPLGDDAAWGNLDQILGTASQNPLVRNLLANARDKGCSFTLLEAPYIDRDFTSSFMAFYASLFRPYRKLCKRLHFFASDLSNLFVDADPAEIATNLEAAGSNYLGYVVLRPLGHAPVSRAFLSHNWFAGGDAEEVSVRATEQIHVLGASLELTGFPLTQQDTRIGACAQAAIWMAGRYFHHKHKAPWYSLSEITSNALRPTDSAITRSLPAGSDYLTTDNMVRALRAMGRHPVFYAPQSTAQGDDWGFDPSVVISQYVDSGIPVILGVNDGQSIGHAVVAVGTTRNENVDCQNLPEGSSQSAFTSHFLVMDDQRGAYLRLPVEAPIGDDLPFTLRDHLRFMIVPLPNKVFLTSEIAEAIARGLINDVASKIDHFRPHLPAEKQADWPQEAEFFEPEKLRSLIARTYLTYGWKYKSRVIRNQTSDILRREVIKRDFPKYVWVTEFSYPEEAKPNDPCARIVRAHVVTDATGSRFWESTLILDCPGVLVAWDFDPNTDADAAQQSIFLVNHPNLYFPKIRGMPDFAACAAPKAG
jgi:hypothetical protein